MNAANDNDESREIKQSLKQLTWNIPLAMDDRILSDAMAAMDVQPARVRFRHWRLAAAIALLAGAGAVIAILLMMSQPQLTLAQVKEAVAAQTWVHIKFDNGREQWMNLEDGRNFYRDHDGDATYTEPNGLRLGWFPDSSYIAKDKWFIGDKPPERNIADNPWDYLVAPLEKSTQDPPPNIEGRIERREDTLAGERVIRFDFYYRDALNQDILIQQIWANPRTRLPVQRREVLQLGQRQRQQRDAIVGTYDFPPTGPSTLEDIGVPAGLPVLDAERAPADDVAAILAEAKAARQRFPSRYRMLVWQPDDIQNGALDVHYRDGEQSSHTRYFTLPQRGVPDFPAGATVDQVLEWIGTRIPVQQTIDDGKRYFSRANEVFLKPPPVSSVQVRKSARFGDNPNYPPGTFWPEFVGLGLVKIDPPAEAPMEILVLHSEFGDQRCDTWIDPAKDYLYIRAIWQKRVNGKWQHDRIQTLGDFKRLPTGQWFAGSRRQEIYGIYFEQTGKPQIENETLDLRILAPEEIPTGTFDGEKLMEGAEVDTY